MQIPLLAVLLTSSLLACVKARCIHDSITRNKTTLLIDDS